MPDLSVMYSSKTDQWATPQSFFEELDAEFHFDLDPCADENNHKCAEYFTKEQDGLKQNWGAPRVLQSAIRSGYRRLGCKMLSGRHERKYHCGASYTGQNGHKVFSRLHITSFRDSLCAGQIEIRRRQKQCAVPINGCYI